MEYEMLKHTAEKIMMPEEMKERIARNCKERLLNTTEEPALKKHGNHSVFRKPAAVLATIAFCFSLSVTAMAAPDVLRGFFQDVTDWRGAVVGTTYEQATDEILVTAAMEEEILRVWISFVDPKKAPYSEAEHMCISSYRILDTEGAVVQEGANTALGLVVGGKAEFAIPLGSLKGGSYRMNIIEFTTHKKADQPLRISGNWELDFVK